MIIFFPACKQHIKSILIQPPVQYYQECLVFCFGKVLGGGGLGVGGGTHLGNENCGELLKYRALDKKKIQNKQSRNLEKVSLLRILLSPTRISKALLCKQQEKFETPDIWRNIRRREEERIMEACQMVVAEMVCQCWMSECLSDSTHFHQN